MAQKSFLPEPDASICTITSAPPSPSTSQTATDRPPCGRPVHSKSASRASPVGARYVQLPEPGSNFITQKLFPPEPDASICTITSARPSSSTSPTLTDRPALGKPEQSKSACSV